MTTKYIIEQAYSMNSKGMDIKDGWHTLTTAGEWGNTYRYKADAVAALLEAGLVMDRKTKVWYDPKEAFDALMNKPEIVASLERLSTK